MSGTKRRTLLLFVVILMSSMRAHAQGSRQIDVDRLATSGTGTAADPWTGWESPLNNAMANGSSVYFPAGYYTRTIPIRISWTPLTTLSGPINNSITSITVASTANFPPAGILAIDTEQISYTGTTATAFTGCTRSVNGTLAASHVNGDAVGELTSVRYGVHVAGAGSQVSIINSSDLGDGFQVFYPPNGSYGAYITINDLTIANSNRANTGAAIDQIDGSYIHIQRVTTAGFKQGLVLDQTEVSDFDDMDFEGPLSAAVWLVNNGEHTPGAFGTFTNRVGFHKAQINLHPGTIGIADDGGYAHVFDDINYNNGRIQLRIANVVGGEIKGSEWEAAGKLNIDFVNTTFYGGIGVGAAFNVVIANNIFAATRNNSIIEAFSVGTFTIISNFFAANVAAVTNPAGGCGQVFSIGNIASNGPLFDSNPCGVDDTMGIGRFGAMGYGAAKNHSFFFENNGGHGVVNALSKNIFDVVTVGGTLGVATGGPLVVNAGVNHDGSGFKHIRVASPLGGTCPTAPVVAAACTSRSINWATAFADNNYTLSCSLDTVTGQPHIVNITKLPNGVGFTVTIAADTAVAANAGIECTAQHD